MRIVLFFLAGFRNCGKATLAAGVECISAVALVFEVGRARYVLPYAVGFGLSIIDCHWFVLSVFRSRAPLNPLIDRGDYRMGIFREEFDSQFVKLVFNLFVLVLQCDIGFTISADSFFDFV